MCICSSRCWRCRFFRRIVAVAIVATVFGSSAAKSDALDLARAGLAAKDRREFTLATRLFDAALREGNFADKDRGLLIYSRGVSYEALGMYDKAVADLDAAIALLPDFPNAYIYRGLVWAEVGMYDRAIADNVYAARLKPNDPMIFNNLGGVYEKKGDWDKAIENYDRAIQFRPDYAEAYYNRARPISANRTRSAPWQIMIKRSGCSLILPMRTEIAPSCTSRADRSIRHSPTSVPPSN